jgi:glucosamine--fructose-6-phosphate aminotransferase (isomerizing)
VGAIARRDVVPSLLEGLKRLEYRGYDSAGVAVLNPQLERLRVTGRVAELTELAERNRFSGTVGIAHTRGATHGAPSERNAHPHVSGGIAVVHNGIIENHEAMRARLQAQGHVFTSDTDTEVIAHLIREKLTSVGDLLAATRAAIAELEGAYAIAVLCDRDPARVIVARNGAPLLLGLGDGQNFAASDVSALLHVTQRVIYLEDGDVAELRTDGVRVFDEAGSAVSRPVHVSQLTSAAVELGP